mgnify:CR=1 FL=1
MDTKRVFLDPEQNIYGMTEVSRMEKEPHSHYMKHILLSLEDRIQCTVDGEKLEGFGFAIQSDALHAIHSRASVLLISVPELSPIGKSMNRLLFSEHSYATFPESRVRDVQEYWASATSRKDLLTEIFSRLEIPTQEPLNLDSRIEDLLHFLDSHEPGCYSLSALAAVVHLSEGRLSRLFHEETGVTLKSYLLLLKLSRAFSLILQGENLTTACIDAGFSSSAHFAYALHKWFGFTGQQLKQYINHVDFL